MKVPTVEQAEAFLAEAQRMNPGPWVDHSLYAALAARNIAAGVPGMDHDAAYILGCLHDIGRRAGHGNMRHLIDGYRFLSELGFADAGRICLTHSFPAHDLHEFFGRWDCPSEDVEFLRRYLAEAEYTPYDRLIQLCDALATPSGFCLIEVRMVDVALRYGVPPAVVAKWKATFAIRDEFGRALGKSIYSVLPGVVENTFGFVPEEGKLGIVSTEDKASTQDGA